MIEKINKIPAKNNLFSCISVSIFLHLAAVGILFGSGLFSDRVISIEGDNSIKAVMIDLTVMAAPEQSLVEDTPEIEKVEETPIIEEQKVEVTPEEVVKEPEVEPDLIVEKDVIEKLEPAKEPILVIKEKPVKIKEKHKNKPPVQQSSQQQIKQEAKTENIAKTAVAPNISSNTQFSATPTPISRNHPEYPRRALDLRIEGHVIVLYDISAQGRVENIRIVDAKPNNIFNRAVIQAMKQWRYQPIKAKDLTIKIVFNRNKSVNFDNA